MTRYLERTNIARALKAETWQCRPGRAKGDDALSGHQYPGFSAPRAPITGPPKMTGAVNPS